MRQQEGRLPVEAIALAVRRRRADGVAGRGEGAQRQPGRDDTALAAGNAADLGELHGPRVDAIDPRPGLAGVGGLVGPAVLVAIRALVPLDVLFLTAEGRGV